MIVNAEYTPAARIRTVSALAKRCLLVKNSNSDFIIISYLHWELGVNARFPKMLFPLKLPAVHTIDDRSMRRFYGENVILCNILHFRFEILAKRLTKKNSKPERNNLHVEQHA